MNTAATHFSFEGYEIPIDLMYLTGGGPDTFKQISESHMELIHKYIGLEDHWNFLELGCGIGRDAIPLTKLLRPEAKYFGLDIISRSIQWCAENITSKYPNFTFHHQNIKEGWFNPEGVLSVEDVRLPVGDAEIDAIILQSVFTHLNRAHIEHYLREFMRALRPGGKIYATFFVLDDEIQARLTPQSYLQFAHKLPTGEYCQDIKNPTIAYGYTEAVIADMAKGSGLMLDNIVYGIWSGLRSSTDGGQDSVIFSKAS